MYIVHCLTLLDVCIFHVFKCYFPVIEILKEFEAVTSKMQVSNFSISLVCSSVCRATQATWLVVGTAV
jgi:hypothetical protein